MSEERKAYKVECYVGKLLRNTYLFLCDEETIENQTNHLISKFDYIKVFHPDGKEFRYSQAT